MKVKIIEESKVIFRKEEGFFKTVLMAGFKYGFRNRAAIIQRLSRQNGKSRERPISKGHVPYIVKTTVTFEFEGSKTRGDL